MLGCIGGTAEQQKPGQAGGSAEFLNDDKYTLPGGSDCPYLLRFYCRKISQIVAAET